ncbi:MAG: cupin domain-containing protein [Deltaproteobacteria bacterium]|nr:cupin domain-containing protein [Deltaproteobacteria bacterium]
MEINVGYKLQQLRKEQGKSLRELSKLSGISANAISLIERNKSSPTIATLTKLILALNTNLTFLFEEEEVRDVFYIKNNTRPHIESKNSKVKLESLGTGLPNQNIEPLIAIFGKGANSGRKFITHQGSELIYCLEGEVEFEIDGKTYILESGDSLFFNGIKPHKWQNARKNKSKVLAIMATKHWLKKKSASA